MTTSLRAYTAQIDAVSKMSQSIANLEAFRDAARAMGDAATVEQIERAIWAADSLARTVGQMKAVQREAA